jgi:cytochrome c556
MSIHLVLLAACLLVSSAAFAQESQIKTVASVGELMELMIIPASDAIFRVSDAPKDAQEWTLVRKQAVLLAESGNLLMVGTRVKDRNRWMKMARLQVDAAVAALKAADDKNFDALLAASDQIAASCTSCHDVYLRRKPSR